MSFIESVLSDHRILVYTATVDCLCLLANDRYTPISGIQLHRDTSASYGSTAAYYRLCLFRIKPISCTCAELCFELYIRQYSPQCRRVKRVFQYRLLMSGRRLVFRHLGHVRRHSVIFLSMLQPLKQALRDELQCESLLPQSNTIRSFRSSVYIHTIAGIWESFLYLLDMIIVYSKFISLPPSLSLSLCA